MRWLVAKNHEMLLLTFPRAAVTALGSLILAAWQA
ncbi:Uncharacterised protein [Providencia stuartii]|nr:Uncharacterised protein [Providencia stuartii]